MDAFWSGEQQGGFTEGLLLRSSGRLIKGWVWPVHPQLRNGLAVSPLNPCHFYLNQQTKLVSVNIATGQRTVVWPKEEQEVEVEITCFSVIDHYVAIGTNCGQLVVLDIAKGHRELLRRAMAPFSRMINAIIGFHQADERRVVVCSNNQAIKVFKFPELTTTTTIDLSRATNFAAISPDAQWMVAVGDRSEFYVFKAWENGFHLKHVVPHIGDEVSNGNGNNMVWWEPHPPYRFAVACEVGAALIFAYPGNEDWSPNPLHYLWSRDITPWAHATSFPVPEISWRDQRDIESEQKMSSVKFISTSSATETGSSLLVACTAGQLIHIYDLERKLRQVIELKSLPCVVALRAYASATATALPPLVSASPPSAPMTIALAETDFSGSPASSEGGAAMSLSESEEDSASDNGGEEQAMAVEDRLQTLEISGIVASADGSKLYVSFEAAPGEEEGYIVELVVNKLMSLRSQCIRFVKQNLGAWRGFDWERHLPSTLLSEIFSPYKFP